MIDERAFAGAEHLDAGYVSGYDRKAGVDVEPDVTLLRELGIGAESTVVDLGAGTGTFAAAIAPHARRVRAASNPAEGWTPAELEQHVLTEHSTFAWLLEPMLDHAGFDVRDVCAKR